LYSMFLRSLSSCDQSYFFSLIIPGNSSLSFSRQFNECTTQAKSSSSSQGQQHNNTFPQPHALYSELKA
jgi:hypothetical protein